MIFANIMRDKKDLEVFWKKALRKYRFIKCCLDILFTKVEVNFDIPPLYGGATDMMTICIYFLFKLIVKCRFLFLCILLLINNSPKRPIEKN